LAFAVGRNRQLFQPEQRLLGQLADIPLALGGKRGDLGRQRSVSGLSLLRSSRCTMASLAADIFSKVALSNCV
jgi:hypothetical protein